ncbi:MULTISPECIES: helix-turn-helix domain-containing protein [Chryseobacterium]|uniref:Helix-turn-helix transcriptional regulator n=1 Tax=Chryseobacterium nepalense TaxID=1854498 RepID=A0ABY4KB64_9FLAO|nr:MULTISPECIES: helix-turn-helix transcriptional regulator [Chryseobacterium]MEC5173994.1 AraC family transcriptional activator of pobA [Chryseobacterium nepalense]UPQ77003.1 helix-turn-helix transcriptional regulator [Chryseobacterium nepalense]
MEQKKIIRIKSISEFHQFRGLPKPAHPLISIVDYASIKHQPEMEETSWMFDFYQISVKKGIDGKFKYGQLDYDFDDGVMFFIAPNQIFNIRVNHHSTMERSGWMLLIHPDFFWNTSLAKTISRYEYFDYSVNEALFLSEKEENILNEIVENIREEYHSNIDKYSRKIIISHIETLLSYAERFYSRQFITREKANHQILDKVENLLNEYFADDLISKKLPTVQYVADALNISPKYLSGLLKTLTGQGTQQHIHGKLIEKAKEKLSTTNLSISEIAYELGFEHSQSFSKLFKTKTDLSPLEFRASFD